MIRKLLEAELLPLEHPVREAIEIYAKRLGILFVIALIDIAILALVIGLYSLLPHLQDFGVSIIAIVLVVLAGPLIGLLPAYRPAHSFSDIYAATHRRDQTAYLKWKLGLEPDLPDSVVWRQILSKSRDIVLRQQIIINALVVGITVIVLAWYLSVDTLEEAGQVLQHMVIVGAASIIGFSIIVYGSRLFFSVDRVSTSCIRISGRAARSTIFGVATILAVALLSPLLGEHFSSRSVIAIGFAISILGSICISTYEMLANLFWRSPRETLNLAIKRLWTRLKR